MSLDLLLSVGVRGSLGPTRPRPRPSTGTGTTSSPVGGTPTGAWSLSVSKGVPGTPSRHRPRVTRVVCFPPLLTCSWTVPSGDRGPDRNPGTSRDGGTLGGAVGTSGGGAHSVRVPSVGRIPTQRPRRPRRRVPARVCAEGAPTCDSVAVSVRFSSSGPRTGGGCRPGRKVRRGRPLNRGLRIGVPSEGPRGRRAGRPGREVESCRRSLGTFSVSLAQGPGRGFRKGRRRRTSVGYLRHSGRTGGWTVSGGMRRGGNRHRQGKTGSLSTEDGGPVVYRRGRLRRNRPEKGVAPPEGLRWGPVTGLRIITPVESTRLYRDMDSQ